jgi:hypothetical protein
MFASFNGAIMLSPVEEKGEALCPYFGAFRQRMVPARFWNDATFCASSGLHFLLSLMGMEG